MGSRKVVLSGVLFTMFSLFSSFKFTSLSIWWYLSDICLFVIFLAWIIKVSQNPVISKSSFHMIYLFLYFLGITVMISYSFHPMYLKSFRYLYVYSIFFFSFIICKELGFNELGWFILWGDILTLIILRSWLSGTNTWVYRYGEMEILRREIITGFGQTNTLCYPLIFVIFLELLLLKHKIYGRFISLLVYLSIFIQTVGIFLIESRMGIILLFIIYISFLLVYRHFKFSNFLIIIPIVLIIVVIVTNYLKN